MHVTRSVVHQQTIMVLGISHHQSNVDARAHLAWSLVEQRRYLKEIQQLKGVSECALLVTCNRCECVLLVSAIDEIRAWWQTKLGVLHRQSYCYTDLQAFTHVVKTCCGLDAKIIGEPQILGQMKRAYVFAKEAGACKAHLGMFFDHIMHHARQIRQSAALGEHVVSLAVLCYQTIASYHGHKRPLHIVCVGAGKVIQAQVRLLTDKLNARFSLMCRNVAAQSAFSSVYDMDVYDIKDKSVLCDPVDVLISATSSQQVLITQHDLRQQQACLCIDLAVPRDIAGDVGALSGCQLVHMDDLQIQLSANKTKRADAVQKARGLVTEAAIKFFGTWQERLGGCVLRGFRQEVHTGCERVLQNAVLYNASGVDNGDLMGCVHRDLVELLCDCFASYGIPSELWPSLSQVDLNGIDKTISVDKYVYKLSQRLLHKPTCWLRKSLHISTAVVEDEVAYSG